MKKNQIPCILYCFFSTFLANSIFAQNNPVNLPQSPSSSPCAFRRVVESVTICQGEYYRSPSRKYTIETDTLMITGKDTLIGFIDTAIVNRCDTTVHFIAVMIKNRRRTIKDTICQGQTYALPNAKMVTKGGIYSVALKIPNKCDSLFTTFLTLTPPFSSTTDIAICQGKTHILPDGKIVNTTGKYTAIVKSLEGCDSIVTTNLTVNPTYSKVLDASICKGEKYTLPDGKVANTEGSFPVVLKTNANCDSIITTILKFYPSYSNNLNAEICKSNPYILPDKQVVKNAGLYPVLLKSIHGCDSLINVNLTYYSAISAIEDIAVFTENLTSLPLKIIENDAFNPRTAWQTHIITPPQYGKLKKTEEGHFDYVLMKTGLKTDTFQYRLCYANCPASCDTARVLIEINKPTQTTMSKGIIPNGNEANRYLSFKELDNPFEFPNVEISIINRWGQLVFSEKPYKNDWFGTNQKGEDLPAGTYYYILRLNTNEGKILKGDVTIIR